MVKLVLLNRENSDATDGSNDGWYEELPTYELPPNEWQLSLTEWVEGERALQEELDAMRDARDQAIQEGRDDGLLQSGQIRFVTISRVPDQFRGLQPGRRRVP